MGLVCHCSYKHLTVHQADQTPDRTNIVYSLNGSLAAASETRQGSKPFLATSTRSDYWLLTEVLILTDDHWVGAIADATIFCWTFALICLYLIMQFAN